MKTTIRKASLTAIAIGLLAVLVAAAGQITGVQTITGTGDITLQPTTALNIKPSGDTDDYLSVYTTSNVPYLKSNGQTQLGYTGDGTGGAIFNIKHTTDAGGYSYLYLTPDNNDARLIRLGAEDTAAGVAGLTLYAATAGDRVFQPIATGAYDLGSTSYKWANVYGNSIYTLSLYNNVNSGTTNLYDANTNQNYFKITATDASAGSGLQLVADNTAATQVGLYRLTGASQGLQFSATTAGDQHFSPYVDSTYDLGTTSLYWRALYTDDVQLSAVAQVGADPMCWDGSGASKIGDCSSSATIKHDIEDSPFGLETIMKLRPRIFKLNSNNQTMVGFIAEETAETVPILVGFRGDSGTTPKTVYYEYSTAILTKAIQEQQTQIELLQTELCKKDNTYKFCTQTLEKEIETILETKTTYYRVDEAAIEQAKRIEIENKKILSEQMEDALLNG